MAHIVCPKCGFLQDGGVECMRCGIIFERYKSPPLSPQRPISDTRHEPETPSPGLFRRFYRIFRWVALAGTTLVIVLILRQSPPPKIDRDPEAAQRIEAKMRQHQIDAQAKRPHTVQLDEAELNSWMGSNLALAPPDPPKRPTTDAKPAPPSEEPSIEEVQSTVRDVKIELLGDCLRAYVLFDFHGKDLSLLLEGRLLTQDGYLRLQPLSGKLGSLPLPQVTLDGAVRRLFDAPENRDKFRLPQEISDIRIKAGELMVSYR